MIGRLQTKILNSFPYVKNLKREIQHFQKSCGFPPGHYYSPIVDPQEYLEQQKAFHGSKEYMPVEINFYVEKQELLVDAFSKFVPQYPFKSTGVNGQRYYYQNDFFTYEDSIGLFCTMMHLKPKKIMEIGSGFSSAMLLDTNEQFFSNEIDITFIEPNPERLLATCKKGEKINLIQKKIQDVDLEVFKQLNKNDLLLIDTSHVSKSGSDVNHIFFNILPHLKEGVKIHIHDIFFPFEYPKTWVVDESRGWNEIFLLRSFLSFNDTFNIYFFNSFIKNVYPKTYQKLVKDEVDISETLAGGIWIEKIK